MIYLKIATLKERGGLNKLIAVFFTAAFFLCFSFSGFSQQKKEEADSLVRLLDAKSAHLLQIDSVSYRKVIGPARFLHNNTYLLCDTALWNVNTNVIDAIGNVQIIQENTFLKSDRIEYLVAEDLAKFRGGIVELFDKDGNILRTNYLDYNTRDSIALFYNGGAMSNPKGDLIESINGAYYSKEKRFSFTDLVNMFTDSVFIVSNQIDYRTDLNKAFFGEKTTAWQQDNILYANSGEFDRPNDVFVFNKDSYILSREQEIWADLLTYFRKNGDADLYNNVQILDTVQSIIALADKAIYRPAIRTVELTREPAIALYSVEKGVRDTAFIAGDSLIYYRKRYCDLDSSMIALAKERRKLSDIDPIAIAESKVAAPVGAGAGAGAGNTEVPKPSSVPDALKNAPGGIRNKIPKTNTLPAKPVPLPPAADSLSVMRDSLSVKRDSLPVTQDLLSVMRDSLSVMRDSSVFAPDSLQFAADTLSALPVVQPDTTLVQFIDAYHHVKMYRGDFQGVCDSLVYTGIDSIARFYKDPILWSEIKNQFTADSIQLVLKNNALHKANLLSNAFIISMEDSIHFNQVKSPEMAAYFANNDLYRYDALGGVSAIFFLQEDSVITAMNQKESKMLSVKIKERQVQRLKYIEQIKNDAHPIFALPMDQQRLRGFQWRAEERPPDRNSVTKRNIKPSERGRMEGVAWPEYEYAKVYFPQRRDSIMLYKQELDSAKIARLQQLEAERLRKEQERLDRDRADSSVNRTGADSLSVKMEMPADSLRREIHTVDSLVNESNRLPEEVKQPLTKAEKRAFRQEQKRLKKEQLLQEREKRRLEKEERRLAKKQERMEKKKQTEMRKQKRYLSSDGEPVPVIGSDG